MKYCKGFCVFFVIVYWIVVTTKTKSWTEQRLHFYFCFYTLRQFYCLWVWVTECMWYLYPWVCEKFNRFCCFWTRFSSSVDQLCPAVCKAAVFEIWKTLLLHLISVFVFLKASSVEAGVTCLAGCCRAVWVTAWNTDCILLGSFV